MAPPTEQEKARKSILASIDDVAALARANSERATDTYIRVENATLEYPVASYRQSLKSRMLQLVGGGDAEATPDIITGFSDLSFTIEHGERIGIIGHNGAGKTTLLRALAGVYPLRSGSIEVNGRIRTLLDLRHGFEIEATGRENIYYRATALGVPPEQIRAAEAEIIKFADIGKFIDMPVAIYSAGMGLRLGFAISTQFAPDILLIDEVFAAGDASFSERASARMVKILAESGIMVMASHAMSLMRTLCTRVIWMEHGGIRMDGDPDDVVEAYLAANNETSEQAAAIMRERRLAERGEKLADRQERLSTRKERLETREEKLTARKEKLEAREEKLETLEEKLESRAEKLETRAKRLAEREAKVAAILAKQQANRARRKQAQAKEANEE